MIFPSVCLGIFAVLSTNALVNASTFEALHQVPQEWKEIGSAPADKRVHFRVAMAQPIVGLLEQSLYDVSTPSHPSYGKHMKRDEIKHMLRPAGDATEAVISWLKSSGVTQSDIIDKGETVHFVASISQAEQMLDTTFHIYRNRNKAVDKIRTLQYSVPEQLHAYIDMIHPTTRFGQIKAQRDQIIKIQRLGQAHSDVVSNSCNTTITPQCLKSLYDVPSFSNLSRGFIGINGFLEEYPRYSDLKTFEQEYAPYMNNASFSWTSVKGGLLNQTSTSDSTEANLDVQYALSVGYPLPGNYYSTSGRGVLVPDLDQPDAEDSENEPYLDLFDYLLDLPDSELPHTLTTSYGEDEQSVPASYAKTVCNQIGQLGLRGVSVLFSSGDTGVASACQTNDGKNTTRFLPIFPASCPYVTSVGGTYGIQPEKAIYFSSGGFSDIWERPSYQDKAVSSYLSVLGDRWAGKYNPAGRGFPDVAAQAESFVVINQGEKISVGGTSAAAPTFAGVVGLLNSARIVAGQPPLGFLNPWIYSEGYLGLTDIVDGGSTGCSGYDGYSGLPTPYVPYASWNATTGWDPVTGYGTPSYKKMLKLALKSRYRA